MLYIVASVEALGDEKRREIMREANLAVVKERADWDKNFATLLKAYERLAIENGKGDCRDE